MSFSVPQFFFIIVLGEHTEIIALTPVLPLLDVFFFFFGATRFAFALLTHFHMVCGWRAHGRASL